MHNVVKVVSQSFGYVLKWIGDPIPSWITSDDGTFCWFKNKVDAIERADIFNKNY